MDRLAVAKARETFSETVNRVAFGGKRIVLHRNGKPLAALVPIKDLAAIEASEPDAGTKAGTAARAEGFLRKRARGRDLVGELLRDRREEVRREAQK
ncbi:MAG: type II toxin-antitoxin system Phd/YefM family antitoxin [Planctomycetes bacterium]|nr:type II toxin-antitoxin system Phd/YefM family antitoxin [Planctomycetota bacterium]